ncbi:enkurin-like isoform X1 [Python bivittatus]|uniref:Enkurin-like isoform X1 n=1 Tax=Python bivittatus TaxID=176946 RepID=A0A9F5J2C9_PYTBI|nr:enkurin-like isoform X1 [Python bivittatus]
MAELCPQLGPEQEENIYHWLPSEEEAPGRPPLRYISTFRSSIKREMQEQRKAPCQTMGIPKLEVPTPKEYLRKRSKEPKVPKCTQDRGRKQTRKPQVPRQSDRPIMGIQSKKNFITTNVAGAIMAVAKKPLRACVDRCKGDTFLLDQSGLVQRFLKKKDFGVTPKYLKKRKKEARQVQKLSVSGQQDGLQQKGLTRLATRDRENVLAGLKENWEEINKEFQSLSVVIDTVPKKLRKEKLETEMKQLEHDISTLEKHKFVYIASA